MVLNEIDNEVPTDKAVMKSTPSMLTTQITSPSPSTKSSTISTQGSTDTIFGTVTPSTISTRGSTEATFGSVTSSTIPTKDSTKTIFETVTPSKISTKSSTETIFGTITPSSQTLHPTMPVPSVSSTQTSTTLLDGVTHARKKDTSTGTSSSTDSTIQPKFDTTTSKMTEPPTSYSKKPITAETTTVRYVPVTTTTKGISTTGQLLPTATDLRSAETSSTKNLSTISRETSSVQSTSTTDLRDGETPPAKIEFTTATPRETSTDQRNLKSEETTNTSSTKTEPLTSTSTVTSTNRSTLTTTEKMPDIFSTQTVLTTLTGSSMSSPSTPLNISDITYEPSTVRSILTTNLKNRKTSDTPLTTTGDTTRVPKETFTYLPTSVKDLKTKGTSYPSIEIRLSTTVENKISPSTHISDNSSPKKGLSTTSKETPSTQPMLITKTKVTTSTTAENKMSSSTHTNDSTTKSATPKQELPSVTPLTKKEVTTRTPKETSSFQLLSTTTMQEEAKTIHLPSTTVGIGSNKETNRTTTEALVTSHRPESTRVNSMITVTSIVSDIFTTTTKFSGTSTTKNTHLTTKKRERNTDQSSSPNRYFTTEAVDITTTPVSPKIQSSSSLGDSVTTELAAASSIDRETTESPTNSTTTYITSSVNSTTQTRDSHTTSKMATAENMYSIVTKNYSTSTELPTQVTDSHSTSPSSIIYTLDSATTAKTTQSPPTTITGSPTDLVTKSQIISTEHSELLTTKLSTLSVSKSSLDYTQRTSRPPFLSTTEKPTTHIIDTAGSDLTFEPSITNSELSVKVYTKNTTNALRSSTDIPISKTAATVSLKTTKPMISATTFHDSTDISKITTDDEEYTFSGDDDLQDDDLILDKPTAISLSQVEPSQTTTADDNSSLDNETESKTEIPASFLKMASRKSKLNSVRKEWTTSVSDPETTEMIIVDKDFSFDNEPQFLNSHKFAMKKEENVDDMKTNDFTTDLGASLPKIIKKETEKSTPISIITENKDDTTYVKRPYDNIFVVSKLLGSLRKLSPVYEEQHNNLDNYYFGKFLGIFDKISDLLGKTNYTEYNNLSEQTSTAKSTENIKSNKPTTLTGKTTPENSRYNSGQEIVQSTTEK